MTAAIPALRSQTCLVLGGCGFIGRNLVERLVADGHHVRIFDREVPPVSMFEKVDRHGSIEYVAGDLSDTAQLGVACRDVDIVYHLVSTTLPGRSNEDPVYDIESNLVATVKLLDCLREHDGIKFIFISSGGTVYGKPDFVPVPEDHPLRPTCSYGICKHAIESYLFLYEHLYGLDYRVLRVSNPYGRYQRSDAAQGVIPVFLARMMRGESIEIWGDGSVTRDFVYITDVIESMIKAIECDAEQRVFNIGSGSGTSLNELVAEMSEVLGVETDVRYKEARRLDVPVNTLDITRAAEGLVWCPTVSLQQGLQLTADWLRETEG